MQIRGQITLDRNTAYYYDTLEGYRHTLPNYLSVHLAWKLPWKLPHNAFVMPYHLVTVQRHITWRSGDMVISFEQNGCHPPGNVSALHLYAVRWCFALSGNDYRRECFIMTPFGCRVMSAVMCVSTETRKNVTNHRGQSQNKQSLAMGKVGLLFLFRSI